MIGIVLVSHGDLGRELLDTARGICGTDDQVIALGLGPDDAIEDFPARVRDAAARLVDVDGVLVLVDLFGGSPANATLRCLAETDYECVSGVNLPMLLEALTLRDHLGIRELAVRALRAGRRGIRDLGAALRDELTQ